MSETPPTTTDPNESHNQPMLTLVELLRRGRERILHGWTQHASATTANGIRCRANDPMAVAWCVTGAIWYTDYRIPDNDWNDACYRLYLKALAELRRSVGEVSPDEDYGGLDCWNDVGHRTQADAVRLYDVTIERVAAAA